MLITYKTTPLKGDDNPFSTAFYRDVPNPFRIADVMEYINYDNYPGIDSLRERLIAAFDLYYANYEISGATYYAFKLALETNLRISADTLERVIAVYTDDVANPVLGRTEKRTYNITNSNNRSVESIDVDVPMDNADDDSPSSRIKSNGMSNDVKTGTEIFELSDLGVRPNYETLNGFIENNQSVEKIFINMFRTNFMLLEAWI